MALARDLRSLQVERDQRVIALLDVGAVAYYSEWFTIDTYGLNDVHVALSRRTDVPYVFEQDPTVIVVVSELGDRYVQVFDWETPIYEQALTRGYALSRSYEFLPNYHLLVLTRTRVLFGP